MFLKIQSTKHTLFTNSSPHYILILPYRTIPHTSCYHFIIKTDKSMSRRRELEHEVSVAQERIKKAAKDTPKNILKLWEQELVDLELELNNMVDDEEDNNED